MIFIIPISFLTHIIFIWDGKIIKEDSLKDMINMYFMKLINIETT